MKKYFFVSYHVSVSSKSGKWEKFYNKVIDIHPLAWQLKMHEEYRHLEEEYVLIYYKEITKEEYEIGLKIEY